jgi:hypothetical protein
LWGCELNRRPSTRWQWALRTAGTVLTVASAIAIAFSATIVGLSGPVSHTVVFAYGAIWYSCDALFPCGLTVGSEPSLDFVWWYSQDIIDAPGVYLVVPLWIPGAIGLLCWGGTILVIRRDNRNGTCRTCGYNLQGNVSGRCPECGNGVVESTKPTPTGRSRPPPGRP